MKIKKEIFFLAIIFLIPFILGHDLKISKDTYFTRELLQGETSGNFISLKPENILLYKDDKVHSEPVIQGFTLKNRVYYFYIILPNEPGNYSVRIENSPYIENGEQTTNPIIKNFVVKTTNTSYISLNKGFIDAKEDFSIRVTAINSNQNINIAFENYSSNQTLYEESEEEIFFSIKGIPTKISSLRIGNYNIPVFITNFIPNNSNISNNSKVERIDFSTPSIEGIVFPNRTYFFNFYIENTGNVNLTNIFLTTNLEGFLFPSLINNLSVNEERQVNLTISIKPNQINNISGRINITFSNSSMSIPVFLEITQNKSQVTVPIIDKPLSCSQIGKICLSDETCNGQVASSLEGPCCIGVCGKTKPTSGSNWIYGLLLAIIVLSLAIYIVWKYKQKQSPRESFEDLLKKKVDLSKKPQIRKRPSGVEIEEI